MAFDTKRYEDEVVKPLRGKAARLPEDLLARYAVEPSMSADDLGRRLREVRAYWNNKARSPSHVGQVCQAFLRADETLRAEHGADLQDPAWWRRHQDARARARPAAITLLADDLRRFYGDLGSLRADQLAAVAGAHADLSDADVREAASAAGLTVVAERELPRRQDLSGLSRDAYRAIADGLVSAGAASIPELLHPRSREFRLLDGFDATPRPTGGLDAAAVTARSEEVARGRDTATTGPTKHVLGRLRVAVDAGVDLRQLALVHLLDEPRDRRAAGAVPSGLVRLLTRAGVAEVEAQALVVQLLAEGTGTVDPLDELRDLLAQGQLMAAGRMVAALSGEAATEGRALVDTRTAEVETLRSQAAEAWHAGRTDVAEQRLRAAADLAADRADLVEELARVPLPPVLDVQAAPDGHGVRVAWTAPPSHGAGTRYRVVRREDREPRDGGDGTVVADLGAAPAAENFPVDAAPPVGRPLRYAVVAARPASGDESTGETPWSPAARATVTVVPTIGDLEILGEHDAIVGRWQAHPDALRVRVRRTGGGTSGEIDIREIDSGLRSFADADVVRGTDYRYELVAVYPLPAGDGELFSDPVFSRAQVDSGPVGVLTVTAEPDAVESGVQVWWRNPAGAAVEIRAGRTPAPGAWGERVDAAEVERWGAVLSGVPRTEGEWTVLRSTVPAGRLHYAAFTRPPQGGPARLIRGQDATFELVAPPSRLKAARRGDAVVLSWVWPDDVRVAEVRIVEVGVVEAGVVEDTRRVTRTEYEAGGVRLPFATSGTVEVRTVVGAGVEQSRSSPVAVEVAAARSPVRYSVTHEVSRLRRSRRCTVSVPPGQATGVIDLVLVAAEGRVMPLTPDAGVEIAREQVRLDAGEPAVLGGSVPSLRRPFWVRCFSAGRDDVVLLDPPVSELKVS